MALSACAAAFTTSGTARAEKPRPVLKEGPAQARPPAGSRSGAPIPDPSPAPPEKSRPAEPKAAAKGASTVATEQDKEGVKTYKFGAVEVEGRMRSPQLIYFLRRVRAEFLAGELGHRSFLPELSDTARQPSFR